MRFKSYFALINILYYLSFVFAASTYDLEAKKFLDNASDRYYKLYNQVAEKVYSNENYEDFQSAFSTLFTVQRIAKELVELAQETKNFNRNRIQSADIKRALENLYKSADLFVLGDEYFSSILLSTIALKSLANDKDIEPYLNGINMPNQSSDPLAYQPDIMGIFQRSNDSDELLHYWKTWREKNTLWASINLLNIIGNFQTAAKIMEISPLEFWYRKFNNNKDFIKDMENVMQEIKPQYQQLHAFIRHQLHKKYGSKIVDPRGPIPDHLFQQVLDQTWKSGSVIEDYFPFNELPAYDKLVDKFDAKSLIIEADKFYQSLGFEALDENFYKDQLKEFPEEENEGDCSADIFDVTPKVFMLYCKKVDFRKFMQNHGHLGRIHYAKTKQDLPAYFFDSYALEYPVGEAVILSASTPQHLTKIELAKDFVFTNKTLENRLLRMGLNTMLKLPLFFIHSKVINDLLAGVITENNINQYYWKLMQEYAGIEPPIDRTDGVFDLPYTFYLHIEENMATQKFVSEVIGYQFYRAFCKSSQQTGALHNCDFSDNLNVGEKLKYMMATGSSKPWSDVIAQILPANETTISGQALLEYYAPILDWVNAKNSENNDEIGWTPTKRKIW